MSVSAKPALMEPEDADTGSVPESPWDAPGYLFGLEYTNDPKQLESAGDRKQRHLRAARSD